MALAGVDDARHPVLGKARSLSQSSLGAFLEQEGRREALLLPPSEFGRYEVKEVDVKSALTICRMPGEPFSLNPYVGCSHDCAYCYVPDVAHLERARWGRYVIVKRNLPTVLSHELKRKAPRDVFLSSATDPYQPVEGTHEVTRRCLELLARADWPLRVLSRNPLLRRDADLFARFSDAAVGMSVPTLDDEARRLVEPGAPPIEGRLRTLRALADEGIPTFANLSPAYPLSGGVKPADVAQAFRDAGVQKVYTSAWRYLDGVVPVLRERVAGTALEASFVEAVQDPRYFERLFRQLRAAFREAGVPLHGMESRPSRTGSIQRRDQPA
jgi:DNA repair photolyase